MMVISNYFFLNIIKGNKMVSHSISIFVCQKIVKAIALKSKVFSAIAFVYLIV